MCTLVTGSTSKISDDYPEVEYTGILREFKYDHGDCRLRKIAICRVPSHSRDYSNYEVIAIFDKLVAFLTSTPRWILLKNQFLYTDEYCDAIQYEGLVFTSTTRGTVFEQYPSRRGSKDGNKLVEDSNNFIVRVIPRAVGNSTNCYLRQACCLPYFHASMDIDQKSVSIHG